MSHNPSESKSQGREILWGRERREKMSSGDWKYIFFTSFVSMFTNTTQRPGSEDGQEKTGNAATWGLHGKAKVR